MLISKLNFPVYGIIIIISIIIGMVYIYYNLKNDICKNRLILLYFIMYVAFAIIFGKVYTILAYGANNILDAGLSAYGGLLGVVIASIIFEKILYIDGRLVKYTILSLPLIYGLTKIACSIVGCCGGILYDGVFKIKYVDVLNLWQFPIQIVDVISFLLIFVICQFCNKNKNINYIVLILVSVVKFLLDFLRHDHMRVLITSNQIFSIILLVVTIVKYIMSKNDVNKIIIKE